VGFPFVWSNGSLEERDPGGIGRNESVGVLETFLWERGGFRLKDLHRARLERGARALGLEGPAPELEAVARSLVEANGRERAVVRLSWTRAGQVGSLREVPAAVEELTVVASPVRAPDGGGHKTTRRELYRIALRRAGAAGADEALLVDARGGIVEGSSTNVFVVGEAGVRTPDLSGGGVAGVCREWLLEAAEVAPVSHLAVGELLGAREVILTNAVRGPRGVSFWVTGRGERIELPGPAGEWARTWAAAWRELAPRPRAISRTCPGRDDR